VSELGDLHRRIRLDLTELLRRRGPEEISDLPVPACPAWNVHDTVAHLAGVGADILAGNLEGVASDPWTAVQVDARRERSLDELLDELAANDPQVEEISHLFGAAEAQWVMDCLTHSFDLRGALGEPVDRDHPALGDSMAFITGGYWLVNSERPVAAFRDGDLAWAPDAGAVATATAPAFELLRGLSGRRSEDQLRAWQWDGDLDAVLPGFTWGPFIPRSEALVE
jgi:uncharacterized protein (TIGR03083 family)